MTEQALIGKYLVKDLASELAANRQRSKDLSDQIEVAEAAMRKLPEAKAYDKLHDDLVANIAKEKELEGKLREKAMSTAIELKIKDPAPGITITKKTTFTVDDVHAALEACRENYPQLIEEKIKKPALKKIVVALGEAISGTTLSIEEYGQVKIATDLSKHYPADEAPF